MVNVSRPSSIPVGPTGRIVRANDLSSIGKSVRVEDDRDGSTGGLYILTWDERESFDDWIPAVDDLDPYFEELGFVIVWE